MLCGYSGQEVLKKLAGQRLNKCCFDCTNNDNTWASVPFGTFLCYDCSSAHRNMGVHISFVQSVKLDKWTDENVCKMLAGGNANGKAFFRQHGFDAAEVRFLAPIRVGNQIVCALNCLDDMACANQPPFTSNAGGGPLQARDRIAQKYSGAVAKRYKAHLANKATNRAEIQAALTKLFPSAAPAVDAEDDFFASQLGTSQSSEERAAATEAKALKTKQAQAARERIASE